jgi:hypothetical protein
MSLRQAAPSWPCAASPARRALAHPTLLPTERTFLKRCTVVGFADAIADKAATLTVLDSPLPQTRLASCRTDTIATGCYRSICTTLGIGLSQCPLPCPTNSVLGDAQSCQNLPDKKCRKPAITRASGHFLLGSAGQCRTSNHSHSIVAGGLLDTS